MKKIILTGASLVLAASILGACSNGETTTKAEDTKQEVQSQANVKELTLTSDSDKQESKMVHSIASSVEGKSDKEKDKLLAQADKTSAATSMLDKTIRFKIADKNSPVSEYVMVLNTYTGKGNYTYTEQTKSKAVKVLKDLDSLVDKYKKDTGKENMDNVVASVVTDSVKAKDKGNNQYEVTSKVQLLDGNETKEYTIKSNAEYNNIIGYMQAKDFKVSQ